jgi:hypothetical protein
VRGSGDQVAIAIVVIRGQAVADDLKRLELESVAIE